MKLDKVILFLPAAMALAAKRLNIQPLSPHDLVVLLSIKRRPLPPLDTFKLLRSLNNPIGQTTVYYSLDYLLSIQFVERTGKAYTIAPLGREYLSLIRRYLLNKRL